MNFLAHLLENFVMIMNLRPYGIPPSWRLGCSLAIQDVVGAALGTRTPQGPRVEGSGVLPPLPDSSPGQPRGACHEGLAVALASRGSTRLLPYPSFAW